MQTSTTLVIALSLLIVLVNGAYKQVREADLRKGGFKITGANAYYPQSVPNTHIHLGIPSQVAGPKVATAGSRFVTFISLKVNDVVVGRLDPDATGTFSLDNMKYFKGSSSTSWPAGFRDALRSALGPMIQINKRTVLSYDDDEDYDYKPRRKRNRFNY
jgi:hypothetical protein